MTIELINKYNLIALKYDALVCDTLLPRRLHSGRRGLWKPAVARALYQALHEADSGSYSLDAVDGRQMYKTYSSKLKNNAQANSFTEQRTTKQPAQPSDWLDTW